MCSASFLFVFYICYCSVNSLCIHDIAIFCSTAAFLNKGFLYFLCLGADDHILMTVLHSGNTDQTIACLRCKAAFTANDFSAWKLQILIIKQKGAPQLQPIWVLFGCRYGIPQGCHHLAKGRVFPCVIHHFFSYPAVLYSAVYHAVLSYL